MLSEAMRSSVRQEVPGLLLLLVAVLFGATFLTPELRLAQVAVNDDVFHLAASERLLESLRRGESFLDPWVSEWSLGYPVWRSYQPLPHLLTALVLGATDAFVEHATAFAWVKYLLLICWPISVYLGARGLGMRAIAAGLASLLVLAPSSDGELGRFGIAYGAFVWRGSGLFTQLVALHALMITLGVLARSLDTGRYRGLAACALAMTGLCHIVFGYVAALSALVLACVAARGSRSQRLSNAVMIGAWSAVLSAWFWVPLWLTRDTINHSRWESAFKWDSFGAAAILRELSAGDFFDAGRPALLSIILLIGMCAALRQVREALPRQLLTLSALWLMLFFGRETWGQLLLLVAVPADFHLHRLQAAFELFAVLLGAWGLHRVACAKLARAWPVIIAAALAVVLVVLGRDREAYLEQSARWGQAHFRAVAAERSDVQAAIADVRALLDAAPGRASAGLASGWGRSFKVGHAPFYTFLSSARLDQASFLYHSMSRASDVMVMRDESRRDHVEAFGVRALVAPADAPMPPHFRRYSQHGRFAVYEASSEGYFGLVDVTSVYTGPAATKHEPSVAWLKSTLPSARQVVALTPAHALPSALPRVPRWTSLPTAAAQDPCGQVLRESKQNERYTAKIALERNCHLLFKMTWDPHLVARVDGSVVPLLEVAPGFGAIPVSSGSHSVVVGYEPGMLRAFSLVSGLMLFVFAQCSTWLRRQSDAAQLRLTRGLASLGSRLCGERGNTAVALSVLVLLALRPLFRGKLIAGHDATEYAPRLVEFARALQDGQFPPLWAADLGNGYGQPLFEFAPPAVYLAALPFYAAGARLIDALHWGLACLHSLGAFAMYMLARRLAASRLAALGVTAAWLFAPYTALDLYVRSAFAEAAAVALAPVAVALLLRCLDRATASSAVCAALGVASIMLSHHGAALLLLPALASLAVAVAPNRKAFVSAGSALALGLALAACCWLPAFAERSFVQTELLRQDFLHWRQHSIAWSQLAFSAWGHGLSGVGTNDGMSFALGTLQLGLGVPGLYFAWRSDARARRVGLSFGCLAMSGAWLATTSASALWERVPPLQYLAYPWRALMLPGLFLPLLCTWSLRRLSPRLGVLAIVAIVVVNIAHTEPKGYLTFDDEYYAPASLAQKGIRTTTREEYAPQKARAPLEYTRVKLLDHNGRLDILTQQLASAEQTFHVRAASATRAEFATFAYPGWTASIDGALAPLHAVPGRGTMSLDIPAGEHNIQLELRATPIRRWSVLVSLVSVLLSAALLLAARVRPVRHTAPPFESLLERKSRAYD